MIHVKDLKPLLLTIVAILVAVAGMMGFSSIGTSLNPPQKQGVSLQNQPQAQDLERWPVANSDASLPVDPGKRAKRQAKGKRYDKSNWPILENDVADSTVRLHVLN